EIGHIDLTIDGFIPISAIEKQDTEAEPGDGWYILFSDFVFSGVSSHTLTAVLSSGGQILDTWTFVLYAILGG
ncbi:MAG: hypothetical protein PHI12_06990, partial [Dehalococcoidales bacterium]|nr:hypothetical protein [Dehalococcoidales bacterium]